MELYYVDGDREVGPIGKAQLKELIKAKKINVRTMVRQPGLTDWEELGRFIRKKKESHSQAKSPTPPVRQSVCTECGQTYAEPDMIRFKESWVCAACKPIFVQKIKEGLMVAGEMAYAGFWIRFGAFFLDTMIIGFINTVFYFFVLVSIPIFMEAPAIIISIIALYFLFSMVIPAAYDTWFVGKHGATPGKMACKIQIITADGQPVSFARALGRHFAKLISSMTMLVGFIMAGFDDQKRSLHDRICDTLVIRK